MDPSADVPIVDITALRRGIPDGDATTDRIGTACASSGFFVVTGHGLDADLAAVLGAAHDFFALPTVSKQRSAMIDNNGYAGVGSARAGGKEMLDIGLDGFHRWPELPSFRDTVERYQSAALAVAADLLRALAVTLDIDPGFFAARMRRPQCFLRMLRYPARRPGAEDGEILTGQHTDYGAITLLATDGTRGLEVRTRDGAWQSVVVPAGSLVVNLGDMLARWTNDRYVSTPHRVVATEHADRYSVPFFVNPDPATIVTCIPTCVTADHPCRYETITAAVFLQGRIDGTIPLDDARR